MTEPDLQQLAAAGVAALQRDDPAEARRFLELAVTRHGAAGTLWFMLAQACAQLGDGQAEERALDSALAAEPGFFPALLTKGERAAARGDDRAAVSFLSMALTNAPPQPSPQVQARLERARQTMAAAQASFHVHLDRQLCAAGVREEDRPPRFREALAILTGQADIQIQQPTSFFYPGLPQTAFYDPADFPWAAELEQRAPVMRAELEALLEDEAGFAPYVERDPSRPQRAHALLEDPRWSAFYLWRDGARVEENARRCPEAMAALELAPLPHIAGRSPMALFSMLRPKTYIPPHWGMLNTRLICHIPLIVPPGCRLRVGNHVRAVEAGKAMIFDDSINHEASNDSEETRVVLLFEIWRPELDEAERRALTAMFESVRLYGSD